MRCNHLISVTALQYKACCSPNDYYIATYKMSYYLIQICASVFWWQSKLYKILLLCQYAHQYFVAFWLIAQKKPQYLCYFFNSAIICYMLSSSILSITLSKKPSIMSNSSLEKPLCMAYSITLIFSLTLFSWSSAFCVSSILLSLASFSIGVRTI